MKIIISPAKKMKIDTDTLAVRGLPCFIGQTEHLMKMMKKLTYAEAKELWKCNEKIAQLNYQRFQTMNLEENLTPAVLAYEGIQYQYMAPGVMEYEQWDYIQEHLYILSGFYGMLKPLDGIVPYRLEMQARMGLYEFWNRQIYDRITLQTDTILNLASKEYARCIESYLSDNIKYITCVFGEMKEGKVIEKGTYAKMARGEMVKFMAEHKVKHPEDIKVFKRMGYHYAEHLSDNRKYIFLRGE